MLAGAARGEKGGGGRVRLSDVDIWELVGFQNQLICRFTWPPPTLLPFLPPSDTC